MGTRRKRYVVVLALVGLTLVLVFQLDDWSRDFTTSHAELSENAADPTLRPLESTRSVAELVEAIGSAAKRIRSWRYVGQVRDGDTTRILFVRTSPVLRLEDDITLRIQDRGDCRIVTGESRAKRDIADLGRNPRNLRRLMRELQVVLSDAE